MKSVGRIAVPLVLWGIAAMGLLANTLLVSAAARGNGLVSDSGYYERGLAWDEHVAAKANADRTGFAIDAALTGDSRGGARLCVTLNDARGRIVGAERVQASASANLCPRKRFEGSLMPSEGMYCETMPDACAGVWLIDVQATVSGAVVFATGRAELEVVP